MTSERWLRMHLRTSFTVCGYRHKFSSYASCEVKSFIDDVWRPSAGHFRIFEMSARANTAIATLDGSMPQHT